MRYFIAILKNVLLSKFAYRLNFFLENIESIIFILVQLMVWISLFSSTKNETVAGKTLSDLITFTIVARFSSSITLSNFSLNFSDSIKSGDISLSLIRPYPPRLIFIFKSVGNTLVNFITTGVPTVLIALFFLPFLKMPASPVHFLLFLLSLIFGLTLSICFELLATVLTLWRVPGDFMEWYFSIFFVLLSGSIIPLWFFPNWLVVIAKMLPFQAAFFTPVQIYLGEYSISGIIDLFLIQMAWMMGLFLLLEILWRRGIRDLVILGG